MKILMALDYYRPNYSGLTLFAEQLAGGLARRGHAVSVLTHRHLPELATESEEDGVRVIRAAVAGRVGRSSRPRSSRGRSPRCRVPTCCISTPRSSTPSHWR